MSLMYKFADKIHFIHCSKASCTGSSFRRTFPREGLPLYNKWLSIMGNCQPPTLLQPQKQSFIDSFTARFPNQLWEVAFALKLLPSWKLCLHNYLFIVGQSGQGLVQPEIKSVKRTENTSLKKYSLNKNKTKGCLHSQKPHFWSFL